MAHVVAISEVTMADRRALIIANSDFDDPRLCRLKTPILDAEAVAEVLEEPGIGDKRNRSSTL